MDGLTIFEFSKNKAEFLLNELPGKKEKTIRNLHRKKFRDKHGLFICEGQKLVDEAIKSDFKIVFCVTTSTASDLNCEVYHTSDKTMKSLSNMATPPGIIAVVQKPDPLSIKDIEWNGFNLALDRINDPGNLGTIIRQADWFGLNSVLISKGSVDPYNPKVVQSAMGSLLRVSCIAVDLEEAIGQARAHGVISLGADMEGENIYRFNWPGNCLLVMGSESHGLSSSLVDALDKQVGIPRIGKAESLNLAAATAILLNEKFRG